MVRQRPIRKRIINELGKTVSLSAAPSNFEMWGTGSRVLVLGLGPQPETLHEFLKPADQITYLECPEFIDQMDDAWKERIPSDWKRIKRDQIRTFLQKPARILLYSPGLRLFPSFWGPVWAFCQLAAVNGIPPSHTGREVFFPGRENTLILSELTRAFSHLGFNPVLVSPDTTPSQMVMMLKKRSPSLFVSINFQGLDDYGRIFALLQEKNIPVAVWCVDNPFHLLSRLKSPFWKQAHLFVTDSWFVHPLKKLGAISVQHLPLATDPDIFSPRETIQKEGDIRSEMIFVGRSRFPDKERFFSGCKLDPALFEVAQERIRSGKRPDLDWWLKKLNISMEWPGNHGRLAGFCAEETSRCFRTQSIRALAKSGSLTVYGDREWKEILGEEVVVREPVDYYTTLPTLYNTASVVLNVTSFLLPWGLTQRHFDVWAAGGFLLTDATPGLEIFPSELYSPLQFPSPDTIPDTLELLEKEPSLKKDLQKAWTALILKEHTYVHRVQTMLSFLPANKTP